MFDFINSLPELGEKNFKVRSNFFKSSKQGKSIDGLIGTDTNTRMDQVQEQVGIPQSQWNQQVNQNQTVFYANSQQVNQNPMVLYEGGVEVFQNTGRNENS